MSDDWDAVIAGCESPIERKMCHGIRVWLGYPARSGSFFDDPQVYIEELGGHGALVFGQQEIGPYRVDLMILMQGEHWFRPRLIVVECDGHAFHSTDAAMSRDAARDRYMQDLDFEVVRIPGREIVRLRAWERLPDLIGVWPTDWKLRGSYEQLRQGRVALGLEPADSDAA